MANYFDFDVRNRPEPYKLYLCKPNGDIVCELNGINEDTCSLTINLNNQYELSFTYNKYVNTYDGKIVESNGYSALRIGMQILVDKIGYFRMKFPPMSFDGNNETKDVTAYSCECELEYKDLSSFSINQGLQTSMEYLVEYDDDETEELLNPYTGIPYDWIVVYNTFPEQLEEFLTYEDKVYTDSATVEKIKSIISLIPRLQRKIATNNDGETSVVEYVIADDNSVELCNHFKNRVSYLISFYTKYRNQLSLISLAIENCSANWSVDASSIPKEIANKKYQFEINGDNIYSFLTNTVASTARCIFTFDLYKKRIGICSADDIGKDSGIFIDRKTVMNTLDINCESDSIYTRYTVSGGNDLGIEYVNFGSNRIVDISWFLELRDDNGNRVYVSDELAEKYYRYEKNIEIARSKYIQYTKDYNQCLLDINELKYREPNDELKIDWDTFSDSELEEEHNVYTKLLVTLETLYKEEYRSDLNADGSINESKIKNTEYWYDYKAYKEVISQIYKVIEYRRNTGIHNLDDTTKEELSAWETEWSLYGTVELQAKVDSYINCMRSMLDNNSIYTQDGTYETAPKTWSNLSSSQKAEYGDMQSNYYYDSYKKYYDLYKSASAYLTVLLKELEELEKKRDSIAESRLGVVKYVDIKDYDSKLLLKSCGVSSSVSESFTDEELKTLTNLYMDGSYSNDNIITTSLDDIVSIMDAQLELLNDAKEEISTSSQPQYEFDIGVDNILAMPEFKDFEFKIGNYVSVEYGDKYYVRLRLNSITFNPVIPQDDISISFTNYILSNAKRTDVSYILQLSSGSGGTGGSSSGSGGGSGKFGSSDDIDTTISNTMLAKLLNTEMFGSRVTDVILDTLNLNQITAKYATFDGLSRGVTTIDGSCIKTGVIVSNNYNGTYTQSSSTYSLNNTAGSIIRLTDGSFSLAGGGLKYDGSTLHIKGNIATGSRTSTTGASGLYISSDGHLYAGASNQVHISPDGSFSLGTNGISYSSSNGKITLGSNVSISWNSVDSKPTVITNENKGTYITEDYISTLSVVAGSVSAENITGTTISGKTISGGSITIGSNFSVNTSGVMTCKGASITGSIIATSFRANGSDNESYFTLGDSLTAYHSSAGSDVRFARFRDVFEKTSSSTVYNYFDIWANQIVFSQTSNGSATIYYMGASTLCVDSHLEISKSLSVDGNIYDKNGSAVTGSDRDIKESISELNLEESSEFIYSLTPSQFRYKEGTSGRYHHGFIAQDVKECMDGKDWGVYILSEETPSGESFIGLRYEEFIADIVATVQLQKNKIDELESIIYKMINE